MTLSRYLVPAALIVGLTSSPALASSFTFTTAAGATSGGEPVSASATLVTGAGTVMLTLTNTLANLQDAGQLVTDFFFALAGGTTSSTTIGSSSSQEITVASNGSFTTGATVSPGWGLDLSVPGTIHLCDIGSGPCTDAFTPAHGLIGAPGGGGTYSAANASIAGNVPHNPFLNQTASWTLLVPGVTATTSVAGAMFSFGTTAGNDAPGVQQTQVTAVPEPATIVLFGSGLLFISARMRRRR